MRNCQCSGGGCSCRVVPGAGISVSGSGSPTDPFVITATMTSFEGSIIGSSVGPVTIEVNGSGIPLTDPFIITATSRIGVMQLTDVDDPSGPNLGDTLVWNGAAFELAPPPSVAPGSVGVGAGLVGDGSLGNELAVAVSDDSSTSTDGLAIYVDSAGELRAVRPSGEGTSWGEITGKPSVFPSTWDSVSNKPTTFPSSWATVSGKPTTFPTSWGEIASRPTTFPSSWATVSGKPTTFPPAAHTHDDRYFTEAESTQRYVGRARQWSNTWLRWNGSFPVFGDVGLSGNNETELALRSQIVALENTKANAVDDVNQAIYARGTTQAHNREAGSNRYAVWVDGSLVFGRATSSIRFKEDVQPWEIDPADVLALEPVSFHRKVDPEGVRDHGLIAEDVYEHLPQIVQWWTDPEGDGTPQIDGLHYEQLAVALLAVVKDHDRRIAELEALLSEREA